MDLEMTLLDAMKQHRIRKVKMFGGGREKSIEILQAAGLFGPGMIGGGGAPAPNGSYSAPPPERYDPFPIKVSSNPPSPQ
jgi:hypothetical protein